MFRTKTLFVIGAGASCELGLPAGGELRHHIMDALDTEHSDPRRGFKNLRVDEAVREAARDVDQARWAQKFADFRETAMKMRVSLPLAQSIDNYLEAHRGNEKIELLGKIGIALSILDAERNSSLMYEVPSPNRPQGWNKGLLASWYIPFIQLVIAGRTLDDIEKLFQNVSFVVFNYDRCLEGFLIQAVTGYYHVSTEVARTLIAGINIVHPYGKVGDLPWQGGVSVRFGGGDGLNLLEIAREIRTFTETVDTGVAAKIKSMVREADTIAFLGFGFLEQNMTLLSPGGGGRATRVFASTYGVSPTDVDIISHEITKLIAKPRFNNSMPEDFQNGAYHSFLEDATCAKLLNSHSHRLTKG